MQLVVCMQVRLSTHLNSFFECNTKAAAVLQKLYTAEMTLKCHAISATAGVDAVAPCKPVYNR